MSRHLIPAITVLSLAACGSSAQQDTGAPGPSSLVINEFMTSNNTFLEDNGTHPDWIELHNAAPDPVDLSGFWMSDDAEDPLKWSFPEGVTLDADGYLLVFADNDPEEGELHATFQLNQLGEDVVLSGPDRDGNPILDIVEAYGELGPDVSFARSPDGGAGWDIDPTPTPGAAN